VIAVVFSQQNFFVAFNFLFFIFFFGFSFADTAVPMSRRATTTTTTPPPTTTTAPLPPRSLKVRSLCASLCFSVHVAFAAAILAALVDALPDLVKGKVLRRFKDPTQWGVTGAKDPRLAGFTFGDFKTDVRKAGENELIKYMCKHSRDRDIKNDFSIALAVAAPGTGKTRLLDDMLRVPLRSTEFEHILRLGVSFNGKTGTKCRFYVASRVIREFFCGPPVAGDGDVLKEIDKLVSKFFDDRDPSGLISDSRRQLLLLCAVEALFVKQRGASLDQCRTVLLVDEWRARAASGTFTILSSRSWTTVASRA
jgi:hypothetical protein